MNINEARKLAGLPEIQEAKGALAWKDKPDVHNPKLEKFMAKVEDEKTKKIIKDAYSQGYVDGYNDAAGNN